MNLQLMEMSIFRRLVWIYAGFGYHQLVVLLHYILIYVMGFCAKLRGKRHSVCFTLVKKFFIINFLFPPPHFSSLMYLYICGCGNTIRCVEFKYSDCSHFCYIILILFVAIPIRFQRRLQVPVSPNKYRSKSTFESNSLGLMDKREFWYPFYFFLLLI